MEFRCNVAPKAVPCVAIQYNDKFGKALPKPKPIFKAVRNGESVFSWIDRCSRKHFTAMDAEAKKLNADDYREMFKELNDLLEPHGDSVPVGTPFSVLADSLAKIEYDNRQSKAAEKPALITIPAGRDKHVVEPVDAREVKALSDDSEITELKQWLDDNEVSYQPNTGVKKLRQYKADKEEELTAPDGDEGAVNPEE